MKGMIFVCDTRNQKQNWLLLFFLAHNFNDTVAMDLKHFKKIYVLHMISHATRFSAAAIMYSKRKKVIIDNTFKHWIVIV